MKTIAYTTDLQADETPALATATALAAHSGACLVSIHATTGDAPLDRLARAADLASAWGKPLRHERMAHTCCEDVTDTLLDALAKVSPDLIVTGTHGRSGALQVFADSVAEAIARNARMPTLVVPASGPGLADPDTGAISLRRIIVPAGEKLAAEAGLEAAAWLAELAGAIDPEIVLLHVDDGTPPPTVVPPAGTRVVRRSAAPPLETAIAGAAADGGCVVVMATRGHDGALDVLRGSHTERVLRQLRCPVLCVPLAG